MALDTALLLTWGNGERGPSGKGPSPRRHEGLEEGWPLPLADRVLGRWTIDGQRVRGLLAKMPTRAQFFPSSNASTVL